MPRAAARAAVQCGAAMERYAMDTSSASVAVREKRMTLFYGPSASIYEGAFSGRFNNHSVVDIVLDDMLYLVDPHW